MSRRLAEFLFWAPRMLCIAFAGFLTLFAFDVFSEPGELGPLIISFVVHLVPAIIVLTVLGILWRRGAIAATIFGAFGVYYTAANLQHPSWVLVIAGPLLLISVLFLLDWWRRSELRTAS